MKKFFSGMLVGIFVTVSGAVFAEDGLEKIDAYLRPSLPITLDGNAVTLESPPVMYDGSTYLKLRDLSNLTGILVNWNEETQTVELDNPNVINVTEVKQLVDNTVPDPDAWKSDPAFVRAQRIDELSKKIITVTDELNKLSEPVAAHEQKKLFDPKVKDDDSFLAAKAAFDNKRAELKALEDESKELRRLQQEHYEKQKAALQQ